MSTQHNKSNFFLGKVSDHIRDKGWLFGHFMDEEILNSDQLEIAWQKISNKTPSPDDKHYHRKAVEVNILLSGSASFVVNGEKVMAQKGRTDGWNW